jgi:hypothetical protein
MLKRNANETQTKRKQNRNKTEMKRNENETLTKRNRNANTEYLNFCSPVSMPPGGAYFGSNVLGGWDTVAILEYSYVGQD